MSVTRHIMLFDLSQSVIISGAEINLTVRAVSIGVLCCNLAESTAGCVEDVHFKTCHDVIGFLLWIGTYCISYVVQQRSSKGFIFSGGL